MKQTEKVEKYQQISTSIAEFLYLSL